MRHSPPIHRMSSEAGSTTNSTVILTLAWVEGVTDLAFFIPFAVGAAALLDPTSLLVAAASSACSQWWSGWSVWLSR